ncbi:Predicted unsaturated glucuronyl hydrolase involved in regulation of bacterial surface properties, and related proteins [Salmonella enterica subsp. arizonae]|uniref:Predicted unsaturated glucuronyl hydrolase involved in regulation of bacterial surface properties, and related proteins n=1 Tax=Salmonella enterica subsp. arizonae TaxID=59203 RepID=A0A447R370_SALER|nr:Predicted unsaturated glucuronyl hydrolase involved in regulation of bacterial surface properties, and related proteins [Salmonella enterica subsp. arizonae]
MSNMVQQTRAQQASETMKRVYRYQATHQTRSVIRRSGKVRFIKDTDWERGVFWSCVAAAWLATSDQEYLDGVMNYTLHTGFRPGPNLRFADDLICCQAYLDVWPVIAIPEALEPTIKAISAIVNEPKPGREDWWWCDALFMAPATFAALSNVHMILVIWPIWIRLSGMPWSICAILKRDCFIVIIVIFLMVTAVNCVKKMVKKYSGAEVLVGC